MLFKQRKSRREKELFWGNRNCNGTRKYLSTRKLLIYTNAVFVYEGINTPVILTKSVKKVEMKLTRKEKLLLAGGMIGILGVAGCVFA